jgi:hypothetical protein
MSPTDLILKLQALIKPGKINPNLQTRLEEVKFIIQFPNERLYAAPFQIDMKNNAIQHSSSLCIDKENMELTSVLMKDSIFNNIDDIYRSVGTKILSSLKKDRELM